MRVVATKLLVPPVRPGQVPRDRLLGLLDGALAHPLTLVVAAAGFDKTTILSAWLRQPGPRWSSVPPPPRCSSRPRRAQLADVAAADWLTRTAK